MGVLCALLIVGCGTARPHSFGVATARPVSVTVHPTVKPPAPTLAAKLAHLTPRQRATVFRYWRLLAVRAYLDAVWHAAYDIPTHVRPVVACIYSYESGIFTEHTHPDSGSGAAQWTPPTWRHWFGRWRDAVAYVDSDYRYAYLAPPLIQEAVIGYTLTHGGEDNWSMRYGNDPCTQGM